MIVPRKHIPKTAKSKIISASRRHTTALPKKRKKHKTINKSNKTQTKIYHKIQIIPLLEAQKIKNISTNQYKAHTPLV